MYDYRPEIQLEKTKWQKMCNVMGYSAFVIGVIISIASLANLPQTVPIHFNFAGEADGWGSKYFVLLLPFIGLVTTLAMEAIENKPHMHNYPAKINESNVEALYKISTRTMNLTKNGVLVVFGLLMVDIVATAKLGEPIFQSVIVVVAVVVIVGAIIWHLVSMKKVQ